MYTLVELHVMCRKERGSKTHSYRANVGNKYWVGPWRDYARSAEADLVDYLRLDAKQRNAFLDEAPQIRQAKEA
jgi:hypothetical protein